MGFPTPTNNIRYFTRHAAAGLVLAISVASISTAQEAASPGARLLLDVPFVARTTGAVVIGNQSATNIAVAGGGEPSKLITVGDGEDYDFNGFSVRVFRSLHSALVGKTYFDPRVTALTAQPPLQFDAQHQCRHVN